MSIAAGRGSLSRVRSCSIARSKTYRLQGLGLLLGASIFLLTGCSPAIERRPASIEPAAPTSPVSVNAVMVALVDHAAHVLWNVAETPPKNDKDWQELEHHAIQLAGSGALLTLGGTGLVDQGWAQQPAWKRDAKELTDASLAALTEVRNRNVEGVVMAGDRITAACESCHKEFKPDIPTEGILHPH